MPDRYLRSLVAVAFAPWWQSSFTDGVKLYCARARKILDGV